MIEFKILTQSYQNKIEEKIRDMIKINQLEEKTWQKQEEEERTVFIFTGHKKEKENTLHMTANIVSDIVQEEVLKKFAESYLKGRKDLKKEEKESIKELFIMNNYMAKEDGVSYISYYVVYTPVLHEIEKYYKINLDGWILFRMKKYRIILQDIIEQTICDYKTQKEYVECITFVVESRRGRKGIDKTLHLIPKPSGGMGLLNDDKEDVTKSYIKTFCEELLDEGDVTIEDLLMNILITVPPKELVIHNKAGYSNRKFIATLELIFSEFMSYCPGCAYCKVIKEE